MILFLILKNFPQNLLKLMKFNNKKFHYLKLVNSIKIKIFKLSKILIMILKLNNNQRLFNKTILLKNNIQNKINLLK